MYRTLNAPPLDAPDPDDVCAAADPPAAEDADDALDDGDEALPHALTANPRPMIVAMLATQPPVERPLILFTAGPFSSSPETLGDRSKTCGDLPERGRGGLWRIRQNRQPSHVPAANPGALRARGGAGANDAGGFL
jgi:hypothetical protein